MTNEKRVEFNPELYKSIEEKILELTGKGDNGGIYEEMVFNYEENCYYDEECLEDDYEFYIERANDKSNPYNSCKILKLNRNFIIKKKDDNEIKREDMLDLSFQEIFFGENVQPDSSETAISSEEPFEYLGAYTDVVDSNGNEPAHLYAWIPDDGPDGLPCFDDDEDNERYGIFVDKDLDEKVAYKFFKTYFARLCLYIGLNNPSPYSCNSYPWSYRITPDYGFHKEWTDEELFADAGLTEEEIAEVYRVLPKLYDE